MNTTTEETKKIADLLRANADIFDQIGHPACADINRTEADKLDPPAETTLVDAIRALRDRSGRETARCYLLGTIVGRLSIPRPLDETERDRFIEAIGVTFEPEQVDAEGGETRSLEAVNAFWAERTTA
ncbi:hypothetical protein [Luteipulveratus halotolerans]|uniref:Uncharacterized protein n=1 Tax=Luteipulveratus halotolerans TaxID=1631356 RepID=A0A0L6CKN6_9MICO|nr:hypothetical protein [Luteipulveratus halotolerans]KNX38068.1 hypothetical protein VV01_14420 [Luteipulveratus halotolerans]